MPDPIDTNAISESRDRAIAEGRYLLIPADASDEELEIYAAILNGELPFSAQPRPAGSLIGWSMQADPGADEQTSGPA